MDAPAAKLTEFVHFVRSHMSGDEKGQAQIFCDRLMQAFGHSGILEAGGALEYRVHQGKSTRFADLLWRPRLLLEMKKGGEKLQRHYQQALEYWLHLVPNRPKYVVLCNFDEFWIYDLNQQLDEPMDRVALDEPRDIRCERRPVSRHRHQAICRGIGQGHTHAGQETGPR